MGKKFIGKLYPSTKEMSKKSMLLNWFKAYSARVLDGAPYVVHWRSPSQFPVMHFSQLGPVALHPVLAHILPPVWPGLAMMVHVSPQLIWRPGTAAAHTVKGQLFFISTVAAWLVVLVDVVENRDRRIVRGERNQWG